MPRSTAPPFPSGLIDGSKEISGDSRLSSLSTTYVVFVVDVATSLSCEVSLNCRFIYLIYPYVLTWDLGGCLTQRSSTYRVVLIRAMLRRTTKKRVTDHVQS